MLPHSGEMEIFMNGKTKQILIGVLCVLLLFIPTIIAVVNYNIAQAAPVNKNSVTKMVLRSPKSSEYIFDKNSESKPDQQIDGDMISYFIELNKNAEPLSSISEPLAGRSFFEAVYYSYDFETVYKYYFSTNPSEAYYVDNNNKTYHIAKEDAEKFIYSSYSIDLYSSSELPVLKIGDVVIKPQTMSWQFLLSNNTYTNAIADLASDMPVAEISSGLDLVYNVQPDYLQVQISNQEEVLFNDLYSNMSSFKFTESGVLNVKLQAKWYEDSTRTSYGEAYYDFTVNVTAPAIFELGTDQIEHGDFVVITGKNVEDGSEINFSSSPDIGYNPVFFRDGSNVYALVPISYTVDYSSSVKFTIECQGNTSELELAVKSKTYRAQNYNISVELISQYRDGNATAAFAEGMAPYFANKETQRYFSGNLIYPASSLKNLNSVKTGYGVYRTLTATGTQYRHDGVDFMVGATDSALAAYGGKVIFAGQQTMSGRTVVIDHGYGLKTLYAHLNSISVSEGDIVEQGQEIGIVGNTGFTDTTMLHFGMYVFNVPVCPYNYFDSEIKIAE